MHEHEGWISRSVGGMAISAIKQMAMRSAGVPDVASLTWGLPSFRTPAYIRKAVESQLKALTSASMPCRTDCLACDGWWWKPIARPAASQSMLTRTS